MTMNIAQTQADLKGLTDAQLKQEAQQYKDDAMMFPLIFAESNERKKIRAAAQNTPPQATVVDQELAQMDAQPQEQPQGQAQAMPENTGIGTLPQQPMPMAEGGIVAFKEKGAVEDSELSVWDRIMKRNADYRANTGLSLTEAGRESQREQLRNMFGFTPSALQPTGESDYSDKANALNEAAIAGVTNTPANLGADMSAYSKAPGAVQAPSARPLTNLNGAPRVPAAPRAPAAPATDFRAQYISDIAGLKPEAPKSIEAIKAERDALMPKEKAYAGLEESLKKEAASSADEKKDAFWMALVQGGLAAASEVSPHGLQNLAKGFGTGAAGYSSALKDLKKADKDRDKAMADIEQARRAEGRGDVDAAISLHQRGQERMDKANDRQAAGLAAITGSQISAEASKYGADSSAAASRYHADVMAAASKAAADRTPAEIQLIERYGTNPKFAAAYEKFAQAKREPQTQETMMKAWSASPQLQMQYPNPADYFTVVGASGGGSGGFTLKGVR